jgi:hypothetical protein
MSFSSIDSLYRISSTFTIYMHTCLLRATSKTMAPRLCQLPASSTVSEGPWWPLTDASRHQLPLPDFKS